MPKTVDAVPLPLQVPEVTPEPVRPATRQELVNLLAQIGAQAKMPHGIKRAQFVRVPADLFLRVNDVVQRELNGMVEHQDQ